MALSHFHPRGRSAGVERFQYGEALTEDQCLLRLQEEQAARRGKEKGKGKGIGRGRGGRLPASRQRSRSPLLMKTSAFTAVLVTAIDGLPVIYVIPGTMRIVLV
ncbi:hypothetical protein ElyMa_000412800 [Elysia marginata]|uniref:Uncharacterized protein n=1 Tax=Elysia marginata TaxID=1093978 RepID=A0AAV4FL15_9GAST|nr:hypothetical protein ElyMa_000412800 [Elysia marginata]